MAHCGGMGLQRERINAGAAARRLRSLEEPGDVDVRRAGLSSAVDAGRTGRLTPPRPPIPPRAGRRGAGKISIGELSGVRPGDTDVTVEHRMRRDAPRLRFTPGHALAAMLLLLAVTCASLTLLVRQSLNYATVGQSASRGTVRPYEDTQGESGATSDATQPQGTVTQPQGAMEQPSQPEPQTSNGSQEPQGMDAKDTRINLNTATLEELDSINGIGPVTARKILDYRARAGGFSSVDQLLEVSGIGAKTLEKIRAKVTV